MKYAYVQQVAGKYSDSGSIAAYEGFTKLGYEVIPFSFYDLQAGELKLSKDRPLNGGIETMQECFRQMEIECPGALDYPEALHGFLGRTIEKKTFGDVRKIDDYNANPVFVKPIAHKAFNGHFFKGKRADNLINFVHVKDAEPVWVSTPVEFVSEWRVYVLHNAVVGIGHYGFGNKLIFPDSYRIESMIDAYTATSPAAYGLDVGVTNIGQTLLVEINDILSLGNYGCRPKPYAESILARWDEVVGNGK